MKICVFGASGRMGREIIREAKTNYEDRVKIIGGVVSNHSEFINSLIDGIPIFSRDEMEKVVKEADICISFTTPKAELENIPNICALKKDMVVGTTGIGNEEMEKIRNVISENGVSAVFSPNFSPLVNAQLFIVRKAAQLLGAIGYDFGIIEEHHTKKRDAPSGTAKKLANDILSLTSLKRAVYRNESMGAKEKGDLDIGVLRLGGTPGAHEVRIVGAHGRLVIETLMYSRAEFAKGAIDAALWLQKNREPGRIFGMEDILGLR